MKVIKIAIHVFLSGISFKIKAPKIADSIGALQSSPMYLQHLYFE